jgi:hypothetical protein
MAQRSNRPGSKNSRSGRGGPDVILDVIFEDGLLFLALRNIGDEPATDVSVTFSERVVGLGGDREVSALPLFHRLTFLAPGREIRAFLDTSASYFARRQPTQIVANIACRGADGRPRARQITHDLEIYRQLGYVRKSAEQTEG